MATVAQLRANRSNAMRSTGPKSLAGRGRVARNSRRHGLTSTEVNPELVLSFYRAIIDDPNASPMNGERDNVASAVLNLAQCEAKLLEIQNTLTALDKEVSVIVTRIKKEGMIAEQIGARERLFKVLGLPIEQAKDPSHWVFRKIELKGDLRDLEPFREAMRERNVLCRYRSEAIAKRRKAFKHWIASRDNADREDEGYEFVRSLEAKYSI